MSAAATAMQFCRSCNNMLYPREDRVARKLMYVCRRCSYEQEAESPVVYKHELVKSVVNQLDKVPTEVTNDPSLSRSDAIVCENCGGHGGVVIQAKPGPTDEKIKLIFVCTNPECLYKWQR